MPASSVEMIYDASAGETLHTVELTAKNFAPNLSLTKAGLLTRIHPYMKPVNMMRGKNNFNGAKMKE
ncbi:hypothetical protein D3C80_1753340 [compost metagenome]